MVLYRFYEIRSLKTNRVYVGKTKLSGADRLRFHHNNCTKFDSGDDGSSNCGSYQLISGGVEDIDYTFKILCEHEIDDGVEARMVEQIFINSRKDIDAGSVCNLIDSYISSEDHRVKKCAQEKKRYDNDEEFRENRNIQMKEYSSTKLYCPACGIYYLRGSKYRHNNSSKHHKNVAEIRLQLGR